MLPWNEQIESGGRKLVLTLRNNKYRGTTFCTRLIIMTATKNAPDITSELSHTLLKDCLGLKAV